MHKNEIKQQWKQMFGAQQTLTRKLFTLSCNEEGSKVDASVPSPGALIGPA